MNPRSSLSRIVCMLLITSLTTGGCVRTRVDMLAAYQPGGVPKIDRTPDVGIYKIKYTVGDDEKLHTLRGSKRLLGAGQPVGFEHSESGDLIAVAGMDRFPALLPPDARYCVWYAKSEQETQFTHDLADTMQVVGVTTLIAGAVVGAAILESKANDRCPHGLKPEKCRHCRG